MKTFQCWCRQRLFFESTQCLACGRNTALCADCNRVSGLEPDGKGKFVCGHDDCRAELRLCSNYLEHAVCNGSVSAESAETGSTLCKSCRLTKVLPDLSIAGHREKWAAFESAKRRLLYGLDQLKLPYGQAVEQPRLRFRFLADEAEPSPVTTGHRDGLITINLAEADDVEREKARVQFNEPQRTLIGHFRHEIGHYYWSVLVAGKREDEFRERFGDERSPDYASAQAEYYQFGPPANWVTQFITAYAAMHPWEDFAETFSAYLDMAGVLETAAHHRIGEWERRDLDAMVEEYRRLSVALNELTRERGLLDLVPEVLHPAVVEKLRFVHELTTHSTSTLNSTAP